MMNRISLNTKDKHMLFIFKIVILPICTKYFFKIKNQN